MAKLKWRGDELKKFTNEALMAGIKAAGFELWRISFKIAGVPNIGVTKTRTRDTSAEGGGPKGSQYTEYPHSSKPGETPRKRTGHGQANVIWGWDVRKIAARVGHRRLAMYMIFHALGIRYSRVGLQVRPTVLLAYRENEARLFAIVKRVAQRTMGSKPGVKSGGGGAGSTGGGGPRRDPTTGRFI